MYVCSGAPGLQRETASMRTLLMANIQPFQNPMPYIDLKRQEDIPLQRHRCRQTLERTWAPRLISQKLWLWFYAYQTELPRQTCECIESNSGAHAN